MITLTERAAKQIQFLQQSQGSTDARLRVFVEAGGCSGFEYGMAFGPAEDGDVRLESQGVEFLIDEKSLSKMKGSEIDFDDGLHGKGFEIRNPLAEATCGCGRSFA